MIISFLHKGLERFYRKGTTRGIRADHADRLNKILSTLDQATCPEDMDLPGLALHPLMGTRRNIWSVKVNGNWRVTFRFNGSNAEIVNYEDYH